MDPTPIADITRPPPELVEAVRRLGAATVAAELGHMGIRDPHMHGPLARTPGKCIAGPAVTLMCMPKREDLVEFGEHADPDTQLHRQVLLHAATGDVVVVDARGDMGSGIFGEMMLTYFKGKGGAGLVIDGCIRDWPQVKPLDFPIWVNGVTPNYHAQTAIMPFAVNVPIACGGVLVIPGDIIVADDDGAVCLPIAMAERIVEAGNKHADWEEFTKMKLEAGGDMRRYYPLNVEGQAEYEAWRKLNPLKR
jgi:regulator of RNase E activity RraA